MRIEIVRGVATAPALCYQQTATCEGESMVRAEFSRCRGPIYLFLVGSANPAPKTCAFSPGDDSATLSRDRSTDAIRLPEPSKTPAAATVRQPRFGRLAVNPTTVALRMNSASGLTPRRQARMEFVRALSAANPPDSRRRSSKSNRRGDRMPPRGDGCIGGCGDLRAASLTSPIAVAEPRRGTVEMRCAR